MSPLQCRFNGLSLPRGKSKVYFLCHPQDFELYFETIAEEILAQADCVIYYRSADSAEDLEPELQQMNLFVIPVTARLLHSENAVFTQDYRVAEEYRIPVLPLLQENGLVAAFAKRFRNLQFLNKFETDPTALPYAEKLRSFLQAVLYGDALAEQIRAAFDAYIFLSYRKKDRRAAQKLMSLIHENDFCRDVAVWYDEFLTPGEDFNVSIEKALEKSDLFALAVTPNLVNEINYIMNIEYPTAVHYGKPIAAVEMEPTDADTLRQCYADIPSAVPCDDRLQLATLLREKLSAIKLSPGNEPRHQFFIGLAYLLGIDVEKNSERAIDLLSQAADAGLDEAYERLVNAYYYGEGTARDADAALLWQQKLTDKYGVIAEKTRRDEDALTFLQHCEHTGRLAYDAQLYEKAKRAYETVFEVAKRIAFSSTSDNPLKRAFGFLKKVSGHGKYFEEALYYLLHSCRMLMSIYARMGFADDAAAWGAKAVNMSSTVDISEYGADLKGELRTAYGEMGELCVNSGNTEGAAHWFALENDCIEESDTEEARLAGVTVHYHYSLLAKAQGNSTQATEYGEGALSRCKYVYERDKRSTLLEQTLRLGMYVSALYYDRGLLYDADSCLIDAEDIMDAYHLSDSDAILEYYRAIVAIRRAKLYMASKEEGAAQLLAQAAPYFEALYETTVLASDTPEVTDALLTIGDYLQQSGQTDQAASYYKKAGIFITDTVAFTKSIRDVRLAAEIYEKLLRFSLQRQYAADAMRWYEWAQYCRYALAQSTHLQEDAARLRETEQQLSAVRELSKMPAGENALITMVDAKRVLLKNDFPQPEGALRKQAVSVLRKFWESHKRFNASHEALYMADLLSRNASPNDIRKPLQAHAITLSGAILNSYHPFMKYDEASNLVLGVCAFYTNGQPANAVKTFRDCPLWRSALADVDYPALWRLLDGLLLHSDAV